MFNYTEKEVIDNLIFNLGSGEWNNPEFINFLNWAFKEKKIHTFVFSIKIGTNVKNISINAQNFFIKDKSENYLLLTIKEIILKL